MSAESKPLISEDELACWCAYKMARREGVVSTDFSYPDVINRVDPQARVLARKMLAAEAMYEALKFAKEIIDDQATRFHQDCRCQLCESCPQLTDAALKLANEGGK